MKVSRLKALEILSRNALKFEPHTAFAFAEDMPIPPPSLATYKVAYLTCGIIVTLRASDTFTKYNNGLHLQVPKLYLAYP